MNTRAYQPSSSQDLKLYTKGVISAQMIESGSAGVLPAELLVSHTGRDRSDSASTADFTISPDLLDADTIPAYTLAVLGSRGSGKSTVIAKALKSYASTPPRAYAIPATDTCSAASYSVCTGCNRSSEERAFSVIELDTAALSGGSWPDTVPQPHGALLCYDASNDDSFHAVRDVLKSKVLFRLPITVMACRSDLTTEVDPKHASKLQRYDVGLVSVTTKTKAGKAKIRDSFNWILKAIVRDLEAARSGGYSNPASPLIVTRPTSWDGTQSEQSTPRAEFQSLLRSGLPSARTTMSTSSTLAYKAFPVPSERRRQPEQQESIPLVPAEVTERAISNDPMKVTHAFEEPLLRSPWWQTVDVLIDKYLFVCVSADDPLFSSRFLLVYRCFTTPRSLLIAMQKALRTFSSSPPADVIFAKFAQSRICHALDDWITAYPGDFVTSDTLGALSALKAVANTVASCTHLLHYASSILSFIETISPPASPLDPDVEWAFKQSSEPEGSQEDEVLTEPDIESPEIPLYLAYADSKSADSISGESKMPKRSPSSGAINSKAPRDRKSSLPLSASGPSMNSISSSASTVPSDAGDRQTLKEMRDISDELSNTDPVVVADEITRLQQTMFLDIKPRHWLLWMFRYPNKDPALVQDSVTRFLDFVNHLAEWVVSLILCHDKAKHRASQIEILVNVATRLHDTHNFSACRSIVAGIRQCTIDDDITMELLKKKAPEQFDRLRLYNLTFENHRAHGAYRQALRNVKGACIPDIDVHSSDILKAHTNNVDTDASDPSKIHWAKWNLIAKFVFELVQLQDTSRAAAVRDIMVPDGEQRGSAAARRDHAERIRAQRTAIASMWRDSAIMSPEMQDARMASLPDLRSDGRHGAGSRATLSRSQSRLERSHQSKESVIRKIFG